MKRTMHYLLPSICVLLVACASEQGPSTPAPPAEAASQTPPEPTPSPAAAPKAKPAVEKATTPAPPAKVESSGDKAAAALNKASKDKKAQAQVNANGVSLAACRTVCAHILLLSLQALPPEATTEIREKHTAKLAQECPPGCMRHATPTSNNCVLRAKTAQQAAACQP